MNAVGDTARHIDSRIHSFSTSRANRIVGRFAARSGAATNRQTSARAAPQACARRIPVSPYPQHDHVSVGHGPSSAFFDFRRHGAALFARPRRRQRSACAAAAVRLARSSWLAWLRGMRCARRRSAAGFSVGACVTRTVDSVWRRARVDAFRRVFALPLRAHRCAAADVPRRNRRATPLPATVFFNGIRLDENRSP